MDEIVSLSLFFCLEQRQDECFSGFGHPVGVNGAQSQINTVVLTLTT